MDYELLDALIQGKKACFEQAADQIWEFAELRYQEHKSAKLQKELLRKEGFTVEAISVFFVVEHFKKREQPAIVSISLQFLT